MAESKLRARLRRLFSTNVIVRHAGGRKLKIADTNRIQQTTKDNLVDRYSRLYSNLATGGYGKSQQITFQSQRVGLFRDYEEMDNDPIISSALDIYADESTMRSEYGDVLNIQSENENIYDILHNLYYDILNIEFNLWPWVRNLCKYGDFYLYLDIKDKYGVTNVVPLSTYDVTRIEGQDPAEPYLTTFHVQDADNRIREDFIGWMNQLNSHENITGATPGPALFPTWTIEALQQDDSISGGQGIQLTNCFPTEVGTLEFNYETVDTFAEFTVTLQYDYWTSKKSND